MPANLLFCAIELATEEFGAEINEKSSKVAVNFPDAYQEPPTSTMQLYSAGSKVYNEIARLQVYLKQRK